MGYSRKWCLLYGQLSGMVEPLGGLLGAAAAVQYASPVLPCALAFAAGATATLTPLWAGALPVLASGDEGGRSGG